MALQVASNLGLSGRLRRLEGKAEAVEVNEMEEVEKEDKKQEETGGREGGEDVKEVKLCEKSFKATAEAKELE